MEMKEENPHGFVVEFIASVLAGAFNSTIIILVLAGCHVLFGSREHDWIDLWYWVGAAFAMGNFNNKKTRARIAFAKRFERGSHDNLQD